MMAVIAIFVLVASFVVPNISALQQRELRQEAQRIAGQLELARQRAVVTGRPHRLRIDLDRSAYRLEWLGAAAPDPGPPPAPDAAGRQQVAMAAPPQAQGAYAPLPGLFGRFTRLAKDFVFVGVETDQGWVDSGEATVAFARDGTTDFTIITLDDASGNAVRVEVLPLAEAVRVLDESS